MNEEPTLVQQWLTELLRIDREMAAASDDGALRTLTAEAASAIRRVARLRAWSMADLLGKARLAAAEEPDYAKTLWESVGEDLEMLSRSHIGLTWSRKSSK